ncbi:hypothetical protein CI109_105729 [Kwoniella shandongensis]|uniref:Uncharacterized protein n=1 Tax=Kwoniella shandongensis TaxID=1734106 RepID=A0A5M6C083_9TREE|nr:uncharacterized protein CI109_003069 [Kwoniella shandongensis]KAA5528537.1 hypothetical protein CI109_003069 [Kwoniella shandongensis]
MDEEKDQSNVAETSKAGLRRMRQLQSQPRILSSCSSAAIHPTTSHLIYPTPSTARVQGYLSTPIFAPSHPSPLPTPNVFTPGRQLSISPEGDWTVIYHPNPSSPSSVNGGNVAIYLYTTVLSPITTPTSVVPLASFPIASEPLAITHLYPPRTHLSHSRAPPCGPRLPANQDPSHGPSFLVLTATNLLLFHPQPVATSTSWSMTVLRCPLHTRWHAVAGEMGPVENDWKVRKGWMGLVTGNEGVWIGWERDGEVGVVRAEIGVDRSGGSYLQTTPMPPLPRVQRPVFESSDADGKIRAELQSVVFVALPSSSSHTQPGGESKAMNVDQASTVTERVGAVLVYHDSAIPASTSIPITTRTRLEVHSFERRQVELAEGFNDIAAGSEELVPSWDWCTIPDPVHIITSPNDTSIVALCPLPSIPPHTLALALLSHLSGYSLAHINLAAETWTTVGTPVDLGELRGEVDLRLVISQGVARGQLGIAAVVGHGVGAVLVAVSRLEGQSVLGVSSDSASPLEGTAVDAATSIILAERQSSDWSDVIRASLGSVGKAHMKEFTTNLLQRVHTLSEDEVRVDQLDLLLRLQVALYGATHDPRAELASDILRLNEVSKLVDECALFGSDGKISFDLDSIWALIGVMEWATGVIATAMRETVLLGAKIDWEGSDSHDFAEPSTIILLAHPTSRSLVLRLLSQLSQLITFLQTLERPILQPETRTLPAPLQRDPMATIVARDRVRDVAYREGVDLLEWGKSLQTLSTTGVEEKALQSALIDLDLRTVQSSLEPLINALPSSSTLFLSYTQNALEPGLTAYDAIDFSPLSVSAASAQGQRGVKCGRCGWRTEVLASLQTQAQSQMQVAGKESPWMRWKKESEKGCVCGGTWVR